MSNSAITQQVQGLATTTSPGLVQAGFYNVLPAGLVFPFAGAIAPSGFLECNGQEVSKTTYANLWNTLQSGGVSPYDTQINPTTGLPYAAPAAGNFRLPDYRGSFLRGVGTASGKDATTLGGYQGEKTKTPTTAFTTATQSVTGSVGGSDGAHPHTAATGRPHSGYYGTSTGGANPDVGYINPNNAMTASSTGSGHGHGFSLTAAASTVNGGGDNETRPINKGVTYIIKV